MIPVFSIRTAFSKILTSVVFFSALFSWTNASFLEISVFDCGQGHTVVAHYNDQTMIFDAGSKARTKFVGFEQALDDQSERRKLVFNIDDEGESIWLVVSDPDVPELTKKEDVDKENKWFRRDFARSVFGDDDEDAEEEEGSVSARTLRGVFISHPDVDHYSLLRELVQTHPTSFRDVPFLLGGKCDTYDSLRQVIRRKIKKEKDRPKIICDHEKSAPYFRSRMPSFTAEEGEEYPQVEILTVNAVKQTQKRRNRNLDSMVVKVSYHGKSFLLPGDAEEETWNSVEIGDDSDPLQSDVFLVAHHGACTRGSTSLELLKSRIRPRVCLISAGFQHKHPDEGTMRILRKYFKKTAFRTQPHFVTYYTSGKISRCVTNLPIFTTMDNGRINVTFSEEGVGLMTDRNFLPEPRYSCFSDSGSPPNFLYLSNNYPPTPFTYEPENIYEIGKTSVFTTGSVTEYDPEDVIYFQYRKKIWFLLEAETSP